MSAAGERADNPAAVSVPHREALAGRGELLSGAGALALLVLMFVFAWYGQNGTPGRPQAAGAENAWNGLTVLRWLMLVTIVLALGTLIWRATRPARATRGELTTVVTAVATLNALLLCYRVLIDLPSSADVVDQKLGAYLGLLSAIAIALGAYDSMRARGRVAP